MTFGRPRAETARRDAFSVFVSKEAMERLATHDWPGNHRELRLFATNALVYCLTQHLDAGPTAPGRRRPRARPRSSRCPIRSSRACSAPSRAGGRKAAARGRAGSRRVEIELPAAGTFARVSAEVEKQYLRALFEACAGDLERMARELLGPRGTARQVHLRLNQLGLRLRELRGTKA